MDWYHLTQRAQVGRILRQGLLVNQPVHLTQGGTWAHAYYRCPDSNLDEGCNPIYLSNRPWSEFANASEELRGLAVMRVSLQPEETGLLVADLPSLIDTGAIIDADYLWWEMDLPPALDAYHDEDYGIEVEELVTPGQVAQAAIQATGTAACVYDIPPHRITYVGIA